MTGLLDRMERDELVERTTDLTDRRVLRIHLTKIGRQVRDPVLNVVDRVITKVFAGIPQEGISQTKNLLRHVLANDSEGKS
jgi:DNA-binding MarR family transcriptional regulator